MAVGKYDDIWKLFKDYTFNIDISNIVSDLLCCLCNGLLRNAQQGPCGCLYCWECVTGYLDADKKYCPGINGTCGELIINMAVERTLDHPADSRIVNLIIPCPIAFCESGVKLKRMREHIDEWHYHSTDNQHKQQQRSQKNNNNDASSDQHSFSQQIASVREMWQRNKLDGLRNEAAVREMREELTSLRAEVVQLRAQMMATAKEQRKQLKEQRQRERAAMSQDDVEWELEIDSDMDDLGDCVPTAADANTDIGTSGSVDGPGAVSHQSHTTDKKNSLSALVRAEVTRQIGDLLRKHGSIALNREPIQLMTMTQTIDLTMEQQMQTNELTKETEPVAEPIDGTAIPMSDISDTGNASSSSRRKLKRTLPVVPPTPPAAPQEPKVPSKVPPTGSKPSSAPSIGSKTVSTPSTASKAPLTPLSGSKTASTTSIGSKTASTTSLSSKTVSKTPSTPSSGSKTATAPPAKVSINARNKTGPLSVSKPVSKTSVTSRNTVVKARKGFASERRSDWDKVMGDSGALGRKGGGGNKQLDSVPSWMRGGHAPPFEFRVDGLAEKIHQARQGGHFSGLSGAHGGGGDSSIFSPAFYSAGPSQPGYKLCLRVEPHSRNAPGYLGLFFCLLRGEHDDRLPWPMRTAVTVSVIDQVSRVPYTSRTFDYDSAPDAWKYVFHRPAVDSAFWFGTPQFIHFDFLYGKAAALVLNDSVLIRCSTST